jgi:hypothetical protein
MKISIPMLAILALAANSGLNAQNVSYYSRAQYWQKYNRKELVIPDVNGYRALTGDFHMHSAAVDGKVTPEGRVFEAWYDGLDILAITDHFGGGSNNRAYDEAKSLAEEKGILFVHGTEVARTQTEHYNFLFIKDANKLVGLPFAEMVQEVINQGGFITLNHPNLGLDSMIVNDFQAELFKNKMIHGIEIFGDIGFYYPTALLWMEEYNLAPFSDSDVHELVLRDFGTDPSIFRPFTILFAKEKTMNSAREALDNRRTLACFEKQLAGDEQLLKDLFKACISIKSVSQKNGNAVLNLRNSSSLPFSIKMTINNSLFISTIGALCSINITVPVATKNIEVTIVNMHIKNKNHPKVAMKLSK